MSLKLKIVQLILAAGSSSRMGEPKQLLTWEDTTLLGNAINVSLSLTGIKTCVVLGANFDLIYKEIANFPISIINNNDWQSGMGSSIRFGIRELEKDNLSCDAVLISLGDQPLIDKEYFERLIKVFQDNPECIIASDLGSRIGVPAIFPESFFSELKELKEDFGARYIIKKYKDKVITVSAVDKSFDIDTLEQYEAMIKIKSSCQ